MGQMLPVLIIGGGIAGLTAALSIAARGFQVRLFENAPFFSEIGAGLQLSPNATHILRDLGLLATLSTHAVRPEMVELRASRNFKSLCQIRLGSSGEQRWGAPYLTIHRADLLKVLLDEVAKQEKIKLSTDCRIESFEDRGTFVQATILQGKERKTVDGLMLVGADGVWSAMRALINQPSLSDSLFSGSTAWRVTLDSDELAARTQSQLPLDRVTALLDPHAHMIAYPVRKGEAFNLVAITRGGSGNKDWAARDQRDPLDQFLRRLPAGLSSLTELDDWTRWPLYAAPGNLRWSNRRAVLIGDAAHAMMPYAAQGAAMAIEDAAVLANALADNRTNFAHAIADYERARRPRLEKVVQRGQLNKLAWNAAGPIALARDLAFRLKGAENLAAGLDWLYGWTPDGSNAASR